MSPADAPAAPAAVAAPAVAAPPAAVAPAWAPALTDGRGQDCGGQQRGDRPREEAMCRIPEVHLVGVDIRSLGAKPAGEVAAHS